MKYSLIMVLFLFSTQSLFSQEFVQNIEEAKELALADDKNVLMVFSGSDWCKPCIQLRETILESKAFQSYSKDHLVVLELDFPYKKQNQLAKTQQKHNADLADKYNSEGAFPKVILMDSDMETIQVLKISKGSTPEGFISNVKSLIQ